MTQNDDRLGSEEDEERFLKKGSNNITNPEIRTTIR